MMESRVILATFDKQNAAFEAAHDVQDLERSGTIKVLRGVIVDKDANGVVTIPDIRYVDRPWGLLGGGVIGALLALLFGPAGAAGALAGAATGATVGAAGDAISESIRQDHEDEFLRDAVTGVEPGQTVLLAELEEEATEPVNSVVARRGGRLFRSAPLFVNKAEQARLKVQGDLTAQRDEIQRDYEADQAQAEWENDTLKENDIRVGTLMRTNQQTGYDVYTNSPGRTSTRPVDDRIP